VDVIAGISLVKRYKPRAYSINIRVFMEYDPEKYIFLLNGIQFETERERAKSVKAAKISFREYEMRLDLESWFALRSLSRSV
jgi:hypothetical protein